MEDAVRERADQNSSQGSNTKDFHSELMLLRKRWRLKRTGASIMGDLTYRSGRKTCKMLIEANDRPVSFQ